MSHSDATDPIKKLSGRNIFVIAVHVDDCTLAASKKSDIDDFKIKIKKFVDITEMGEAHWLLGIKIERDRDRKTISLSQEAYVNDILRRFNFDELKPASTPMDPTLALSTSQAPQTTAEMTAMRHVPYREAIGSLMYAAMATRPDIAFAVTLLSRFSLNPGPTH